MCSTKYTSIHTSIYNIHQSWLTEDNLIPVAAEDGPIFQGGTIFLQLKYLAKSEYYAHNVHSGGIFHLISHVNVCAASIITVSIYFSFIEMILG